MRIAVVDDVPADREALAESVTRWAAERGISLEPIAQLASGEDLLETFLLGQYDVIFLDIYMPGMDGMEAARRIRDLDTACRLVFITNSRDFAVESYDVGAAWYLVKPWRYEKLAAALDRCGAAMVEHERSVTIPGPRGEERLRLHQIAWTEYQDRRIRIYFRDGGETQAFLTQREFAALLLKYPYFCDCMKGIIVNFEAVEKLREDAFLLCGGTVVPISRLKYRDARERFWAYSYQQARGGGDGACDS